MRTVARLEGLLCCTWLSAGAATRVRTRLLAAVVDSRPPARSDSRRDVRLAWRADVTLTLAARDETRWWVWFLTRHNGAPIRPRLFDASVDGDIASDARDTGTGAIVQTRHGDPAASSCLGLLAAAAPPGL